jgi:hypothetical protein
LQVQQFLANPFNVIDYLSDWFGRFLGVGHDADKLLVCAEKVGTLEVITLLFPFPRSLHLTIDTSSG